MTPQLNTVHVGDCQCAECVTRQEFEGYAASADAWYLARDREAEAKAATERREKFLQARFERAIDYLFELDDDRAREAMAELARLADEVECLKRRIASVERPLLKANGDV